MKAIIEMTKDWKPEYGFYTIIKVYFFRIPIFITKKQRG